MPTRLQTTLQPLLFASRTVRALTAVLLFASLFAPGAARALELNKYDALPVKDKARYDEILIRGSESFLRRQGKTDMANRLVSTFDVLQPGKNISAGMEQFGREIQAGQSYQIRTGKLLQIEHVLLVAFKKFGIEIPQSEMMSFAKDFRPAGGR